MPNVLKFKKYFSLKIFLIALTVISVLATTVYAVYEDKLRTVSINDNGNIVIVHTTKSTVEELLDEKGIIVAQFDFIEPATDQLLTKNQTTEVKIKRAVSISIISDGKESQIMTYKDTIGEALADGGIALGALDRIEGAAAGDKITAGMIMKVVRVEEKIEVLTEGIDYTIEKKNSNTLAKGKELIETKGAEGKLQKNYKVVYENGIEINRELTNSSVIQQPVTKIVLVGTKVAVKKPVAVKQLADVSSLVSRGDIRYSKVLKMRGTTYTANFADTGKKSGDSGFGRTCSGTIAKKGTVAVDPKVIPLGTRLYVACPGATQDYGYAIAEDIGGAVKGDIIDLYYETTSDRNNWYARNVVVYILE